MKTFSTLFAILFAIAPAPAAAQGAPISGTVVDSVSGGTLAGATVRLNVAGASAASVTTGSDGRFRFTLGGYTYDFADEGKVPGEFTPVAAK